MEPPKSKTKVSHKKLGREKVWGFATPSENHVELDTRLKGYRYLLYAVHEKTHLMHPDWSETKVKKYASEWARYIWHLHFRKIEK